jgi:hypothetical protein
MSVLTSGDLLVDAAQSSLNRSEITHQAAPVHSYTLAT